MPNQMDGANGDHIAIREFSTGANRNAETGKYDYDGFLSPLAIEAFGAYMHFNRHLDDGTIRDSDNWQKGIPLDVYRKSLWRHFLDTWRSLRGISIPEGIIWALCGILFNVQGLLHELLKENPSLLPASIRDAEARRAVRLHKS
jgi:hypothetical protein